MGDNERLWWRSAVLHPFQHYFFHRETMGDNERLCAITRCSHELTIFTVSIQTGRSKQCRPRWDAAECGISSGSTLFATLPVIFRDQGVNCTYSNFRSMLRSWDDLIRRANMLISVSKWVRTQDLVIQVRNTYHLATQKCSVTWSVNPCFAEPGYTLLLQTV